VTPDLWRRIGWIAAAVVAIAAALWFAAHIPRTLAIFTIAAFIAFGVEPVARRLSRRMSKPLAISLVFAVLLLIVAVGMVSIVPLTIEQMQLLASNLPGYATTAQGWVSNATGSLNQHFPQLHLPKAGFDLAALGGAKLSAIASGVLSSVGALAFNAAAAVFVAFSAIVLSFFFLLNDSQIVEWFAGLFPTSKRDTARNLAAEVTQVFGSYISGQIIVSAITGFVIAVASAVIGFKFSLILGLISGVAYAVPIVGMLVAELLAVPLCLPQGIWMVIWVQVIMFGMARISDTVLVPKIMGESVGVSPIAAMFAIFAGGELFGIPGLLLGIPAAALLKILWRYFMAPWLQARLDRS
jgi:predicted PurR-regulated permease PerM